MDEEIIENLIKNNEGIERNNISLESVKEKWRKEYNEYRGDKQNKIEALKRKIMNFRENMDKNIKQIEKISFEKNVKLNEGYLKMKEVFTLLNLEILTKKKPIRLEDKTKNLIFDDIYEDEFIYIFALKGDSGKPVNCENLSIIYKVVGDDFTKELYLREYGGYDYGSPFDLEYKVYTLFSKDFKNEEDLMKYYTKHKDRIVKDIIAGVMNLEEKIAKTSQKYTFDDLFDFRFILENYIQSNYSGDLRFEIVSKEKGKMIIKHYYGDKYNYTITVIYGGNNEFEIKNAKTEDEIKSIKRYFEGYSDFFLYGNTPVFKVI